MKQILLMVLFVGLMSPAGLYAQKVYKDASDRVILELTIAAGMPRGAITNTAKQWTSDPSNNNGPIAENTETGSINATVFQKLEIAPNDMNTTGGMDNTGNMVMNWASGFNGCKESTYDGGRWRLPTQRELQLMYIFLPALQSIFNTLPTQGTLFGSGTRYWSATECDATTSWVVLYQGNAITNTKTSNYNVRCVREVTD
ncbi:DUF1566 domain-containing protein [Parabacteroides sp. AF48-14]|uniref:Lcl domain-containing protein n=1 Tax=Parabacteroides sp. AF48-14 TaxID=2292052 RepID=UPI000EFFB978|nr:DUF1566 domain-containing protein [Parabacteroides sp. AF48-14]RHO67083.1 DUF1566 domain-containing protein [Parabacteroides sp. AF48-14]